MQSYILFNTSESPYNADVRLEVIVEYAPLKPPPNVVSAVTSATATRRMISAYSISVCPSSPRSLLMIAAFNTPPPKT